MENNMDPYLWFCTDAYPIWLKEFAMGFTDLHGTVEAHISEAEADQQERERKRKGWK